MATIQDYDSLVTAVTDWTLRDEMPIDTFIGLIETKLRPILRHYKQDKQVTIPLVDKTITLPNDMIEPLYLRVNGYDTRQISLVGGIKYANEVVYKQVGDTYEFDGPQDVGEPGAEAVLLYRAVIPAITEDTPTNWLIQRFPDVYFHGVLYQAYRWMKDMESFSAEYQSFQEALSVVAADDLAGRSTANVTSYGGPIAW